MESDAEFAQRLGEQDQAEFEALAKNWRAAEKKHSGDGYDEEENYRFALAISQQDDFDYLTQAKEQQRLMDEGMALALRLQAEEEKSQAKEQQRLMDEGMALALRLQAEEEKSHARYVADSTIDNPDRIKIQVVAGVRLIRYRCPHGFCGGRCAGGAHSLCGGTIETLESEIACTIFRHGMTMDGTQIGQHLSEEAAAQLLAGGTIRQGCCCKQYYLEKIGDDLYRAVCCTGR
jgi:hypothetical protein